MKDNEDLIICDLAETYNVIDYKKLPLSTVAILVYGLRDNSRLKMKIFKSKMETKDYLLAGIFDRLTLLVYANTKDAQKGRNKPKLLLDMISKEKDNINSFNSSEDFEKAKMRILKNIKEKECDDNE